MWQVRTFYEAAKVANRIPWPRELDKFSALQTVSTCFLIVDKRTRKYMEKVIHDDMSDTRWIIDTGVAIKSAMEELERDESVSPGRLFKRRRDNAIKGLESARSNLIALDHHIRAACLIKGPESRKLKRALAQFERADMERKRRLGKVAREKAIKEGASDGAILAASFSGLLKRHGNKVPDLTDLLKAAIEEVANISEPKVDRHGARSQYLREMFWGLRGSSIHKNRIAFLAYACEAVFGEHVEKREVRRLVSDLETDSEEPFDYTGVISLDVRGEFDV
jgi:hypothetical protein